MIEAGIEATGSRGDKGRCLLGDIVPADKLAPGERTVVAVVGTLGVPRAGVHSDAVELEDLDLVVAVREERTGSETGEDG